MKQNSTKEKILESAYSLFRREGFARVSVDAIAGYAGVTKRTVYYHFQSKDDIVAEVLTNQHDHLLDQFQNWVGSEQQTPVQFVEILFTRLHEWADSRDYLGSGYTRIATELADRPGHPARKAASLHKSLVEQWMAKKFEKTGYPKPVAGAQQIMTLIEGSMILALIHGDAEYICSAGNTAKELVETQSAQ